MAIKKRFTPLEWPSAEARGKIKYAYAVSYGVNASGESFLTGFAGKEKIKGERDKKTS
jgi:hypothetical protein